MIKLGYAISSEEHHPGNIVHHAQRAEEVGFTYALISDHFLLGSVNRAKAHSCGQSSVVLPRAPKH
jgi:alkanesulfonate monooxygenase SsuD/methylene tetrahydromethanopterin reductase-like flavin-dependent oxidoreductase (luciferase family)